MRQSEARQLARAIFGAHPVSKQGTHQWGVLTPSGNFVTDVGKVWEPARTTVARAFDQDEKVRELFIDDRDDGALYAVTATGAVVHIDGVPWQLIVTGYPNQTTTP